MSTLPSDGWWTRESWLRACSVGKLGSAPRGSSYAPSQGAGLTCWCGARGQGCVFWQSIRRVDEEQEQRVDMEFLVYGTRTSKDKSGAYLFLPDGEAQVPYGTPSSAGSGLPQECRVQGDMWPEATRTARAFLQGDPTCHGAVPGPPLGVGGPRNPARGLRPEPAGSPCICPTPGWYLPALLSVLRLQLPPALFPALRPQGSPCAACHRRPFLLRGGGVLRARSPGGPAL